MTQAKRTCWTKNKSPEERAQLKFEYKIERRKMFYEFQIKQAVTEKDKIHRAGQWLKREMEFGNEASQTLARNTLNTLKYG